MRLANPHATEQDMIDALEAANAWSFIKGKMTKGLDTLVGGTAGGLSGG